MDDQVKIFTEDNIKLIEQDRWEEVYEKAARDLIGSQVGKFTQFMLEADIHPEQYLKELPESFLSHSVCREFIIPNHITSIGEAAFTYCTNLTNITIPNSVTSIGEYAFLNCSKLTNLVIGDNVTSIGEYAFCYCESLINVVISNNIIRIDSDAFMDCGNKLVIDYRGSKKDWEKIYNAASFSKTQFTVNCIDGKIVKKKR